MNVLMLGWELPPLITGGLGNACEGILRAMAKRVGVRTTFALPAIEGTCLLESHQAQILQVDMSLNMEGQEAPFNESSYSSGGLIKRRASAFEAGVVREVTKIGHFDVIHAHDWMTFGAAIQLKKMTGKKFIAHVHSTEFDRAGPHQFDPDIFATELRGMADADKIVTVSDYSKNVIVKAYGQDAAKVAVVFNGAESKEMEQLGSQAGHENFLVTYLGRITYQKGPESFVEAARLISNEIPSAKFVMAGDGDLVPLAKSWVRASGMQEIFSFPGFLDETKKRALLRQTSIFIMPSVSEPFGIAALEAINAGVPVIISKRSGLIERVNSVIAVDPFDVGAIASAAIALSRNRHHAWNLVKTARQEALELTWEAAVDHLAVLYNHVLN
jgi:glycosyltransferase involved in cell wall biosynthesis